MASGPHILHTTLPPWIRVSSHHIGDDRDISLPDAWDLLSSDEIDRAHRFHFDRDRNRYVRSRGILRNVLAKVCMQSPSALVFDYGPQGKPWLTGGGPEFNLSHSNDIATIALSEQGPVGIDVEAIDRKVNITGLAETCMTADEQQVLNSSVGDERRERFFAFWTAKEARMKLTGEGMALPPQSISLALTEGWPTGYEAPKAPVSKLAFVPCLAKTGAICCVSYSDGGYPSETS